MYILDASCGGQMEGPSGRIVSPNYPGRYGNNEYCEWSILAEPGHILILEFIAFDIENSDLENSYCPDYVQVSSPIFKILANKSQR